MHRSFRAVLVAVVLAACVDEDADLVGAEPLATQADANESFEPDSPVTEAPVSSSSLQEDGPQLSVYNRVTGCFQDNSELSSIPISDADLARLRSRALASRGDREVSLEGLGIAPTQLARHLPTVLGSYVQQHPQALSDELRAQARRLLTPEYVLEIVRGELASRNHSTTQTMFEVAIPGEPPIRLSTSHLTAGLLPWHVQVGADSWDTYSMELPLLLSQLLPPTLPSHHLLDGRQYWSSEFWSDSSAWSPLLKSIGIERARQLAMSLPGYAEIERRISIKDARFGYPSLEPGPLDLELTVRAPDATWAIDGLRWFDPASGGTPGRDWRFVGDALQRMDGAAQRLPWLLEWRRSGARRTIEGRISSERLFEESDLDSFVNPAWQHAGYPGAPSIELVLRDEERVTADLYTSEQAPGALIVSAGPSPWEPLVADASGSSSSVEHWLEHERVHFHPTKPIYLVIDMQGHVERRVIPADFPPLAQVLRAHGVRYQL